ncbi:MAG: fibrinogen-like YCDxxxxGGGW domain-containing protein [Candidatus Absconditabacteria bacterium]
MAIKLKKFLKSFTLIELIIVIAVIAVLGASAFLVLSQWMSKSRDSRKIADLGTIDTAISISITSNDKLPVPDNKTDILFSGNIVWEVGYFGDEAVKQIGGSLTKTPIDPTTKQRYRYGVWSNKYQLGTIIENEQFSRFANRAYAKDYFTRLKGNYSQSIIVAKIDNVDTILPVPSLIVDEFTGTTKTLGEEYFWINKNSYNIGGQQSSRLKVESLYSGDLSLLSDSSSQQFLQFKNNFEKVYTGNNILKGFNSSQSKDEIKLLIAKELSKVSSQPVSVQFLGCEGYEHGSKIEFYKQELLPFGQSCDNNKEQFECDNGNWIGENKIEYQKTACTVQQPIKCNGVEHGADKNFFKENSVAFGECCDDHKKNFTCYNGVWKDGLNSADTSTYRYSSCVVGNPVHCEATSIVKKSVNNLDITFDIDGILHGQSFEKIIIVNENNGSYEYTLVGDCSNGEYQDVELSTPVYKNCDIGYTLNNGLCVFDAIWSGNSIDGYTYLESGSPTYPISCNDLLLSTNPNFKYGINSLYNGTEFLSGNYYIKPTSSTLPIKVYCDMSEQGGGWTVFQSLGNWNYENYSSACHSIELFSTAVIDNMKLVSFNEFDIKTDVEFRIQADDSVNNSRIRTRKFSDFSSYDILMGDGYNNTVLTLTDNKIYCTASDSNNKCGVTKKPSRNNYVTNIFINRLQFNPRCNSSTAYQNTRSRNKFTWKGTYYNLYFR